MWLLLPALSTVSSRGKWQALAEAVGDQREVVSFDWPGFGDSDRPATLYDAALLTPARIRKQQRLARRPRARFASVAFVSGGLDPADDRPWWLQQARLLQCPLHVVLASEAPPRSRTEMEALGWQAADQLSVIPGRLSLHQECGALLALQLLESDASPG